MLVFGFDGQVPLSSLHPHEIFEEKPPTRLGEQDGSCTQRETYQGKLPHEVSPPGPSPTLASSPRLLHSTTSRHGSHPSPPRRTRHAFETDGEVSRGRRHLRGGEATRSKRDIPCAHPGLARSWATSRLWTPPLSAAERRCFTFPPPPPRPFPTSSLSPTTSIPPPPPTTAAGAVSGAAGGTGASDP
jgi:hypothetical protein